MTFAGVITPIGIAVALAVSGISHAYLYIHGYRHIPTIGTAFVAQASVSFAVAALILVGGPAWLGGPRPCWPAAHWSHSCCHARSVRPDSFWGIVATR
jgi:hypothetical protein